MRGNEFMDLVQSIREDAIREAIISQTENYEDLGEPVEAFNKVALNFNIEYDEVVKKYYELLEGV